MWAATLLSPPAQYRPDEPLIEYWAHFANDDGRATNDVGRTAPSAQAMLDAITAEVRRLTDQDTALLAVASDLQVLAGTKSLDPATLAAAFPAPPPPIAPLPVPPSLAQSVAALQAAATLTAIGVDVSAEPAIVAAHAAVKSASAADLLAVVL